MKISIFSIILKKNEDFKIFKNFKNFKNPSFSISEIFEDFWNFENFENFWNPRFFSRWSKKSEIFIFFFD